MWNVITSNAKNYFLAWFFCELDFTDLSLVYKEMADQLQFVPSALTNENAALYFDFV